MSFLKDQNKIAVVVNTYGEGIAIFLTAKGVRVFKTDQYNSNFEIDEESFENLEKNDRVISVVCGEDYFAPHFLFLTAKGAVYALGSNGFSQLGINTKHCSLKVITKINLENVVQIATSFYHSLFLLKDGSVYGSGSDRHGQLGLNEGVEDIRAVKVLDLSRITQVKAGAFHSAFLTKNGDVYLCGSIFRREDRYHVFYNELKYNISYINFSCKTLRIGIGLRLFDKRCWCVRIRGGLFRRDGFRRGRCLLC